MVAPGSSWGHGPSVTPSTPHPQDLVGPDSRPATLFCVGQHVRSGQKEVSLGHRRDTFGGRPARHLFSMCHRS